MSAAAVSFDRVSASYRGNPAKALDDVTFDLTAAVTFLIGENGAGKTTLFRLALGAMRPSQGSVTRSYAGAGGGTGVGYLPQEFTLPPQVSVARYLAYLAFLKRIPRRRVPAAVAAAALAVGLDQALDEPLGRLSGGRRRRVGLAQAVLGEPRLVLLDEPTANLDPASRVAVRQSLATMARSCQLVVSTHLTEDIGRLVEDPDLLVLHQGSLVFRGRRSELAAQQDPAVPHASADESRLIAIMRGGVQSVAGP